MKPFDESLLGTKNSIHLNGGRAFNKTKSDVVYDGKIIGGIERGRIKKNQIFIMVLGDEEFDILDLKRPPVEIIKEYLEKTHEKSE